MNNIQNLFQEEANEFDRIFPMLIPFYDEIYNILAESIPFKKASPLKILDIGCGTGTLAEILKLNFPFAEITCIDFSDNMLEIAKNKLKKYPDVRLFKSDFHKFKPETKYDVVVSSFALHHIENDFKKVETYRKIFNSLNKNGIFLNADIVLGANEQIENLSFEKWKQFLGENFSDNEIENDLLPRYQTGDNPSKLFNHLKWLRDIGFMEVETIWKYYGFTIFAGIKNN